MPNPNDFFYLIFPLAYQSSTPDRLAAKNDPTETKPRYQRSRPRHNRSKSRPQGRNKPRGSSFPKNQKQPGFWQRLMQRLCQIFGRTSEPNKPVGQHRQPNPRRTGQKQRSRSTYRSDNTRANRRYNGRYRGSHADLCRRPVKAQQRDRDDKHY